MIRQHCVVVVNAEGVGELHRMKDWLRANPHHIPPGVHPDRNTSHEVRAALRKAGWQMEVRPDQVLLFGPGAEGALGSAGVEDDGDEELEVIQAEEITFGLERDLQSALRAHIEQLEPGLRIIDGGRERVTEAGRLDITAVDCEGVIVVIELKAGTAAPEAVAQILAYMGTIADEESKPVRGILVAGGFHKRVVLASRAITNLALRKYSFQFKFDAVS